MVPNNGGVSDDVAAGVECAGLYCVLSVCGLATAAVMGDNHWAPSAHLGPGSVGQELLDLLPASTLDRPLVGLSKQNMSLLAVLHV